MCRPTVRMFDKTDMYHRHMMMLWKQITTQQIVGADHLLLISFISLYSSSTVDSERVSMQ